MLAAGARFELRTVWRVVRGEAPVARPPVGRVTRFHGVARLDTVRLARDAGQIAEAIVQHLARQPGAEVKITLVIQAQLPQGASDELIRTVGENARTLKFTDAGFEAE